MSYDYYDAYNNVNDVSSSTAGVAGALGIGMIIFYFAIIALMLVSMWKVFVKCGKPGWACIIPIYNIITMLEIAEKPAWYLVLCLIPFANIYVMWVCYDGMAKKLGKSTGFTVGMLLLPVIFFPILAFSKSSVDQFNDASAPVMNNEVSNIQPEAPVMNNEMSNVQPEAPVMNNEVSNVQPEAPVMNNEVPNVQPEAPVMNNEVPNVQPQAPVMNDINAINDINDVNNGQM